MYILGIILLFILPFAAGTVCKSILRWKETNQIETYLIGFFFVLFLQGVILAPCVFLGLSFDLACTLTLGMGVVLLVLGTILFLVTTIKEKKQENTEEKKKLFWRKGDKLLYFAMMVTFVLVVAKIIFGQDILRDDIVLETVNTTINNGSMFTHHPLTGMMMDGGMIASKKIVTLPLFYAAVVKLTGAEADVFLYLIVNVWVVGCSYYACLLLFSNFTTVTRSKIYSYLAVFGLLLLSGDYHKGTLPYRLLYQGYEGVTICFGVLMPYLLYVIFSWYKRESEEERTSLGMRFMYLLKIVLVFATSMVISSLGTGFLFLFLTAGIVAICCLLKSVKEVRACKE